jgi:arylsulfatase
MKYTFTDAKRPSTHKTQYFEMLGNQIYHDGWVAANHAAGPTVEFPQRRRCGCD